MSAMVPICGAVIRGGKFFEIVVGMRAFAVCVLVACGGGPSGGGGGGGNADAPSGGPGSQLGGCPLFPANFVFNTPIDSLPVDPHSGDYITTIGGTKKLHLDLGTQIDQQAN